MRQQAITAAMLLLCACSTSPETPGTGREPAESVLSEPTAAQAIRTVEDFGDPIYLEVWAAESPTARRLEARGYVRIEAGRMVLTEQAVRLGASEDFFQDDIPVLQFPVGRLELVRITAIRSAPQSASPKRVEFRYRRAPTRLGQELIEDGSRLDEIAAGRDLPGIALITPSDSGWTVAALEL